MFELWNNFQTWFSNEFSNNQFLVGFMVPFVIGGLAWIGRGFVFTLWSWAQRAFSIELEINTDEEQYRNTAEFLYNRVVAASFRRRFTLNWEYDSDREKEVLKYGIGYGTSIGFMKGHLVVISRSIEDSDSSMFKERINIRIIGRRGSSAQQFHKELSEYVESKQEESMVRVFTMGEFGLNLVARKPKRSLETVALPADQKDYLIGNIDQFLESEQYHTDRGIPYHMGIMLYGEPGTGKSSLIHTLASHYNREIVYVTSKFNIQNFNPQTSILVFEDIDASVFDVGDREDTDKKTKPTMTMSEMLNLLDGIMSPHGMITVATTNHYEKLDPALVRHGRFDVQLELGKLEWEQWVELCEVFDRESPVTREGYVPLPPATARYRLTYYSDDEIRDTWAPVERIAA